MLTTADFAPLRHLVQNGPELGLRVMLAPGSGVSTAITGRLTAEIERTRPEWSGEKAKRTGRRPHPDRHGLRMGQHRGPLRAGDRPRDPGDGDPGPAADGLIAGTAICDSCFGVQPAR